jgi:hypothetical protein
MTTEHVWTLVAEVVGALWVFSKCPVDYTNLKYVGLGQFSEQFRRMLFEWVGWSISLAILHFLFVGMDLIMPPSPAVSWKVPDVVSLACAFVCLTGFLTWSLRGRKLEFPQVARRQWIVLNDAFAVGAGMLYLAVEYLPTVAAECVVIFFGRSVAQYTRLIEVGDRNYESVSA